jgi:branched-chain amino acid aminotransferase
MYSSIVGGIVTDPVLMCVPIDDHLVHRADGVFDVSKCVNGKLYCYREHLARLERSAAGIELAMPAEFKDIDEICFRTILTAGNPNVILRIMVSRGPGGFSTNPAECPAGVLYVVVSKLHPPKAEAYEKGVSIISTPVPVKPQILANIKSCDYLGNVLIKKAAVDAGVDFAVTWDEEGFLAEGSTENIFLVTPDREMLVPDFDRVLRGITVTRVIDLARELVDEGLLKEVRTARIAKESAERSVEVMLCGTTLDVLPVTKWGDRRIGDGTPGPVARRLLKKLRDDIAFNEKYLTPIF